MRSIISDLRAGCDLALALRGGLDFDLGIGVLSKSALLLAGRRRPRKPGVPEMAKNGRC